MDPGFLKSDGNQIERDLDLPKKTEALLGEE